MLSDYYDPDDEGYERDPGDVEAKTFSGDSETPTADATGECLSDYMGILGGWGVCIMGFYHGVGKESSPPILSPFGLSTQ